MLNTESTHKAYLFNNDIDFLHCMLYIFHRSTNLDILLAMFKMKVLICHLVRVKAEPII